MPHVLNVRCHSRKLVIPPTNASAAVCIASGERTNALPQTLPCSCARVWRSAQHGLRSAAVCDSKFSTSGRALFCCSSARLPASYKFLAPAPDWQWQPRSNAETRLSHDDHSIMWPWGRTSRVEGVRGEKHIFTGGAQHTIAELYINSLYRMCVYIAE